MELENLLVEMTKHIHKSDWDSARELIKAIVVIGRCDNELSEEILGS